MQLRQYIPPYGALASCAEMAGQFGVKLRNRLFSLDSCSLLLNVIKCLVSSIFDSFLLNISYLPGIFLYIRILMKHHFALI